MKKKINKDYTKHWLYPYIGSYAMNFVGMLIKYGSLIIDNMGFYRFNPRKKWTIK